MTFSRKYWGLDPILNKYRRRDGVLSSTDPIPAGSSVAIIVFGSANVDISVDVEALPRSGETVHCSDFRIGLGGKGLNQAVAASRLSESPVMFVGAMAPITLAR